MSKKTDPPADPPVSDPIVPDPAEPSTPPGTVSLTVEEHDRLQAENRTSRKKLVKLEEDETARKAAEAVETARLAGDFDTSLGLERAEKERLKTQLALRDVSDAVREEISALGFSGTRATGLQKLVSIKDIEVADGSPSHEGVQLAVAATIAQYPDLFQAEETETPDPTKEVTPMRRKPGPAAPPNTSLENTPPDFVSPEEYVNTPHAVRMTRDFQERVRKSRPYWPVKVPATSFSVDQ